MSAIVAYAILPTTTIETYLTNKATGAWGTAALVVRVDDDEKGSTYLLRRVGHSDVVLGSDFHAAKRALLAAIRFAKAGGQLPD